MFKPASQGDLDTDQGYHDNTGQAYLCNDFTSLQSGQTKSCVNLSNNEQHVSNHKVDVSKKEHDLIKCRSVENVNHRSDKQGSEEPVPPRRPLRKKRSARGRNDLIEKVTSQGNNENGGKMAMEYSSSSPDMSPRQTGSVVPTRTRQITTLEENQSISEQSEALKKLNHYPESVDIMEQKKNINASSSSGVSSVSKHSSHSKFDSSSEESPRDITLMISRTDVLLNKGKIVEIGGQDSENELEIERVEFDSQKRNFQNPNLHSSCFEDDVMNENVQSYLQQTLKPGMKTMAADSACNSAVSEAKSSKDSVVTGKDKDKISASNSRSLENLDDIDRLLKIQVGCLELNKYGKYPKISNTLFHTILA